MISNADLQEPSMYWEGQYFGPAAHVLGQWLALQHVAKTVSIDSEPFTIVCINQLCIVRFFASLRDASVPKFG